MARLGTVWRRQSNEIMRLIKTAILGVVVGFLIGISFLVVSIIKLHFPSSSISCVDDGHSDLGTKIYVPTNPRGAESLAPGIIVPESDFYLRRLWGNPSEDLPIKQKYLVAFTVGLDQKHNIDAAVKKDLRTRKTIGIGFEIGELYYLDEYTSHVACFSTISPFDARFFDYRTLKILKKMDPSLSSMTSLD